MPPETESRMLLADRLTQAPPAKENRDLVELEQPPTSLGLTAEVKVGDLDPANVDLHFRALKAHAQVLPASALRRDLAVGESEPPQAVVDLRHAREDGERAVALQRTCVMREVGSPFCVVCMEAMVRKLYRVVRPIDEVWPKESEQTREKGTLTFRLLVLQPRTRPLQVRWERIRLGLAPRAPKPEPGEGTRRRKRKVKGVGAVKRLRSRARVVAGRLVHEAPLRVRSLEPGRYTIRATVVDPTPWVLPANRAELTQVQEWVLTVPPR